MPRNFYIDKYEPTPEARQKQQFENSAKLIVESIEKIHQSEIIHIEESVLMIDVLADIFRMMAKSMGKSFAIDDSCISCGMCQKQCPKKNISYVEKTYGSKCMLCTRCIHNCPVNAISYKGKKIQQYKVHHSLV